MEKTPTRRELKRSVRLATGPQLYVLNRAGWLGLRTTADVSDEITNEAANNAIQASIEEQAE